MNSSDSQGANTGAFRLRRMRLVPLMILALASCQSVPGDAPYQADPSMGMLIARDSCSSCHSTGLHGESPNPRAVPFREVINRPGLTPEALAAWLKDGHDYPAEMGFVLAPHQVDSLVAYMTQQLAHETASQP